MEYIRIIKAELDTFWYANRIGKIYKIDPKVKFDGQYTIRLSNGKNRAPFGLVKINDAEIVETNFIGRIFLKLGLYFIFY